MNANGRELMPSEEELSKATATDEEEAEA